MLLVLEQQPGELADEERVPACALVQQRDERFPCVGVGDLADEGIHQVGHVGLADAAQGKLVGHVLAADRGQGHVQLLGVLGGQVPVRRDQQHRLGREAGGQVRQQLEAGQIRPLEVVEGDHHGSVFGGLAQERGDRLVEQEPHRLGVVARHRGCLSGALGDAGRQLRDRPRGPGARAAQGVVVEAGGQGLHDLQPGPERRSAGRGRRPAGVHGDTASPGLTLECLQQCGLADAWFAGHEQQRSGVAGGQRLELRVDVGELASPAHDHGLPDLTSRCRERSPRAGGVGARGAREHSVSDAAADFIVGLREGCEGGCCEGGVVLEDPLLQVVEAAGGSMPSFLLQQRPERAVRAERLCCASGPVQGEHQQGSWFLPQGMFGGERLEAGQRVSVSAESEESLEASLDRAEIGLGELGDGAPGRFVVGDLGEGVALPRPDGVLEGSQRFGGSAEAQVLASLLGVGREPGRVHTLRRNVEAVALAAGDEGGPVSVRSTESLAEVGDVGPQGHGALRWWGSVPELVDEALGGDDAADVHQEQDEQCSLPAGDDRCVRVVDEDAQGT